MENAPERPAQARHRIGGGGEAPALAIAVSPTMQAIEGVIRRQAQAGDRGLTVLVRGERGTGKEVLAHHAHLSGPRAAWPFLKLNCSTLTEPELLEKFSSARGGTFFLDEVSRMSPGVQAALLQLIRAPSARRPGEKPEPRVNSLIVAATRHDLEQEVEAGRLREELYFRLKTLEFYLPPLRERRQEIPLFMEFFCARLAKRYGRPVPELSQRLLDLLVAHPWPGNVRELEGVIKQMVILGEERTVLRELLSHPGSSRAARSARLPAAAADSSGRGQLSLKAVGRRAARAAERDLILETLDRNQWNRRKAARTLGVSYKTLLSKMKHLGLADS